MVLTYMKLKRFRIAKIAPPTQASDQEFGIHEGSTSCQLKLETLAGLLCDIAFAREFLFLKSLVAGPSPWIFQGHARVWIYKFNINLTDI